MPKCMTETEKCGQAKSIKAQSHMTTSLTTAKIENENAVVMQLWRHVCCLNGMNVMLSSHSMGGYLPLELQDLLL